MTCILHLVSTFVKIKRSFSDAEPSTANYRQTTEYTQASESAGATHSSVGETESTRNAAASFRPNTEKARTISDSIPVGITSINMTSLRTFSVRITELMKMSLETTSVGVHSMRITSPTAAPKETTSFTMTSPDDVMVEVSSEKGVFSTGSESIERGNTTSLITAPSRSIKIKRQSLATVPLENDVTTSKIMSQTIQSLQLRTTGTTRWENDISTSPNDAFKFTLAKDQTNQMTSPTAWSLTSEAKTSSSKNDFIKENVTSLVEYSKPISQMTSSLVNDITTRSITSQDFQSRPSLPTNQSEILPEETTVINSERLLDGVFFGDQATTAPKARNPTGIFSNCSLESRLHQPRSTWLRRSSSALLNLLYQSKLNLQVQGIYS